MGLMASMAAHADAIDGNWCSTDQRHFSISGPNITTPGGATIVGDYDRHAFAYVVPQGETGAGDRIAMRLINDDTLHLRAAAADQPAVVGNVEVWSRCEVTS
jgi:hypothetical protein